MIQAIIFDMDGVLIDSEPLWKKAILQVMQKLGYNFTIEMCNRTKGMRVDEVTHYWKQEFSADFDSKQIAEEIVDTVIALIQEKGKPMAGLNKVLETAQQEKLKIALASSSSMRIIKAVLNKLAIADYFEVIHSAEMEEYGKPHPQVFITTAKQLNISPQNCLVIEDSLHGVIAGKAAKMKVIALPETDEKNLSKFAVADSIISSLTELTF